MVWRSILTDYEHLGTSPAPLHSHAGRFKRGYRNVAAESRSADRAPGYCVLRQGKGLPPLAPHPHPRKRPPTSASLRMESIPIDEAEHCTAQSSCQRRYAPMVFGIARPYRTVITAFAHCRCRRRRRAALVFCKLVEKVPKTPLISP